jgi:biotin-dependent carboxylase-like uncharacterized protein
MITSAGQRQLEVVRAGAQTTIQDLGRTGYAHLGVPTAGAVDRPALRLANRLVGNPPEAAGLEITLTGCTLRFNHPTTIAVTGAEVTRLRVGGRAADTGVPTPAPSGAVVEVGPTRTGLRTYLAVAGGIDVAPVLNSRATDTLSGLGPPVLRDGDLLPVGIPTGCPAPVWFTVGPPAPTRPVPLRVRLGPRDDWFTRSALGTFTSATYTVSTLSNRVGARLTGPMLTRAVPDELPSEGVVFGAVQVPADGQPLIFLADHPTTGGYPVIAVVDESDLPLIAQCRPGTPVTFVRQE